MEKINKRIFVEKKNNFNIEARHLFLDLKQNLNLNRLENIRILNCYDIFGISLNAYKNAIRTIFSEPNVDIVYEDEIEIKENERYFGVKYHLGQYDQRADSASQCIEILTQSERPIIKTAKIIILVGRISDDEFLKVKNYCINPVDQEEFTLDTNFYEDDYREKDDVEVLDGFIDKTKEELKKMINEYGLAMSILDLEFLKEYFKSTERRDPTITELKVIDTYWSDHCRHTTFLTEIEDVEFEEGILTKKIKETYNLYMNSRNEVIKDKNKKVCLMDLATISMKELREEGKLNDLDVSDEINACSIVVPVEINGTKEDYLIMFKNETHNHPTEIEPFGGAATCLGGAIRDPLSGRSYVYQSMRITGSGDPRAKIKDTIFGKLPQRIITTKASDGFSSYGNQIGISTGFVDEIYDEGYIAKRMEIGAVIAATPKENVVRKKPSKDDVILLLGGRTGRDGIGGATGSSKEHTEESILSCGAEVQKGNPPTERKIQRLFRNPKVSKMIKKCNDFGAGGVSVAIGELADSIEIYLDNIPKKYEGLDGTELALSESQERMAVVIANKDIEEFISYANKENLEATVVAKVTDDNRLKMIWKNKKILDISRDFLNTNGVRRKTIVKVNEPDNEDYFTKEIEIKDIKKALFDNLKDLNICSKKGLIEKFDSTIGANTVLMPFGGKYQLTPSIGMVSKIPVLNGETDTCTIMTYGYDPKLSKWSPYHGALYAVIDSITKIVCIGGDYKKIRLTFQEYFEKLGKDKTKWGKPFSALLGAYLAQRKFKIAAIGGKDSMSGTFNDLNVPPTLVSFAVCTSDASNIISQELKSTNSVLVLIKLPIDDNYLPNFDVAIKNYTRIHELIKNNKILSSSSVGYGGIASTISKMCFGNKIGFVLNEDIDLNELFKPLYGSIIIEVSKDEDLSEMFNDIDYRIIGNTHAEEKVVINKQEIDLNEMLGIWEEPLKDVFPIKEDISGKPIEVEYKKGSRNKSSIKIAKPRIFIPIFPGTNCEYDTAYAFEKAGGIVETMVFRNLTSKDILDSINEMVNKIKNSQIIALPGGFSAGDEPDGSGKFIATIFRNPYISEAVMEFLKNKDGLMIGICNGFQALIKLGLLPYGEIKEIDSDSPTLTFNKIGRHISNMTLTKVVSNLSPWFNNVKVGDIHRIPVSHGEGRFYASKKDLEILIKNGQIATQYVDFNGNPSYDGTFNPNGSFNAIEGITSPDGRILGKMGHSERVGKNVCINVPGEKDQKLFLAGVNYFS